MKFYKVLCKEARGIDVEYYVAGDDNRSVEYCIPKDEGLISFFVSSDLPIDQYVEALIEMTSGKAELISEDEFYKAINKEEEVQE